MIFAEKKCYPPWFWQALLSILWLQFSFTMIINKFSVNFELIYTVQQAFLMSALNIDVADPTGLKMTV